MGSDLFMNPPRDDRSLGEKVQALEDALEQISEAYRNVCDDLDKAQRERDKALTRIGELDAELRKRNLEVYRADANSDLPRLFPAVLQSRGLIEEDIEYHGCAYVIEASGQLWMVHPNKLTVYGEPKHKGILQ